MPVRKSGAEYRSYRREVGQSVARDGDSTAIALKSYVSPEVFRSWEPGAAAGRPFGNAARSSDCFLDCIHYDQSMGMEDFKDADPLERRG